VTLEKWNLPLDQTLVLFKHILTVPPITPRLSFLKRRINMKVKTILALSIAALSLNTFAYEGHGFRIISEKFTTTSKFGSGIREVEKGKSHFNDLDLDKKKSH
jgi:hypothetical protein